MNKKLIFFERTDIDEAINKKFKKYTLEVDDAIEAYGLKPLHILIMPKIVF